MGKADNRTKMIVIRFEGRAHVPVAWATGDHWAAIVAGEQASADKQGREYGWREARPGEITKLQRTGAIA